jgi:trehalose-6-phosphate synthase
VKGPLEKIVAFGEFLEEYPAFCGNVELVYICTPPSEGMRVYEETQRELNQAIEKINEKFANMEWAPVHFIFRSVPFEEVIPYYAIADVAWVTPLRDGLNLVAKEYVAVQGLQENPNGVLVISEFAGASVALPYALLTNPYDIKNMKEILLQALTMNKNERKLRMQHLSKTVSFYDVEHWSKSFLGELSMTRSPILEKNESKVIIPSKKSSYTSCLLKK